MSKRDEVVSLAKSWVGLKESDGSYKKILDIYNSQKKPPRGVKMDIGMSWCAATWSAIAIKLGYTDIMPIEISCGHLIEKAKKMGIWKEKDDYIPKVADGILYDWGDSGKGDCTGWPDHVGVVKSVNTISGYLTIIEGNYQDQVKIRRIKISGRYIRGFIAPKYDDGEEEKTPVKKPVKKKPTKKLKEVTASRKPLTSEKSIAGKYKVTASSLRIRDGGSVSCKVLCVVPENTVVKCLGKRTGNWFFVQVQMGNILYKGYAYRDYLEKA